MLSAEQNDRITRTGPQAPAGTLLRRYWQPAALVDELAGNRPIKPVTLLGEQLVMFRDEQGRYGLVGRACPHRGTDLAYGRLEDGGLRCAFHGWLFDVTGRCLQTPAEPDDSNLCAQIRHKAYPVVERSGILFAYMGPGEPPALPHFDCFVAPDSHTFAFKGMIDCNWLQSLEVGVDPAHTSFLHRFFHDEDPSEGYGKLFRDTSIDSEMPMTRIMREFPRPRIEIEPTDYGMRVITLREISAEKTHVRVTNLVFPNAFVIPMSREMTITQWHVPIDDRRHYWWRDPGSHAGASRTLRQGDHRLSPPAADGDRRSCQRRKAADGARPAVGRAPHRPCGDRRHRPDPRLAGLLAAHRRQQAQGCELGQRALTAMSSRKQRAQDFVERHALWSDAQSDAARVMEKAIKRHKLEALRAIRNGVTMTSTLLAKDTCHRTVFPVFTPGSGLGFPAIQRAGNIIMVPDPTTFRVLPWASDTGWVLCDIVFPDGGPIPFSTRTLYRDALARLAKAGFDYFAGLEVEFHLFKLEDPKLAPAGLTWPAQAPSVSHTTHGYQYLTEAPIDRVDAILQVLRGAVAALGLPLRSIEVEYGPSQFEFTFAPEAGMAPADTMVLFRSAMKQVAHRHGYLASFMCRPNLPNVLASGWHLHQSLLDRKSQANDFVSYNAAEVLSPIGRAFLAGLLAHARAAAAFATPTLNGYKRYHGVNSMAPIQAIWARDNRGVMVRVMGEANDPATHLENRIGEPLANPYLYMASQIHAGLDGIARKLKPGPSADSPYELSAELLPKSLAEALDALQESNCFRSSFGDAFVDYFLTMKRAEIARATKDGKDRPDQVTDWEHNEYFDMP